MGFQGEQWSKVATFDETQITSSADRDPFIIMFKKITAPAEIVRWWYKIRLSGHYVRESQGGWNFPALPNQFYALQRPICMLPCEGIFFHHSSVKCSFQMQSRCVWSSGNGVKWHTKIFSMIDFSKIVNKNYHLANHDLCHSLKVQQGDNDLVLPSVCKC